MIRYLSPYIALALLINLLVGLAHSEAQAAPSTAVQASISNTAATSLGGMRAGAYELRKVTGLDNLQLVTRPYTDGNQVKVIVAFVKNGREIPGCHGVATRDGKEQVFSCTNPEGTRLTYRRYAGTVTRGAHTFEVVRVKQFAIRVTAGGNTRLA